MARLPRPEKATEPTAKKPQRTLSEEVTLADRTYTLSLPGVLKADQWRKEAIAEIDSLLNGVVKLDPKNILAELENEEGGLALSGTLSELWDKFVQHWPTIRSAATEIVSPSFIQMFHLLCKYNETIDKEKEFLGDNANEVEVLEAFEVAVRQALLPFNQARMIFGQRRGANIQETN